MNPNATNIVRSLGFCALLATGSCSVVPDGDTRATMLDGAANNPIMVEPSYRSLKVDFMPAHGGLTPAAAAQLGGFVAEYRGRGTGSIAISAPANSSAQGAIGFFAERINQMGIARDKILVATHDAPDGDMRVEVNYVGYVASTRKCGDWSDDLGYTLPNRTPRNFGCAVQQNLAANLGDPRDLLGPRTMDPSNGGRRAGIIGLYEQGKVTQAEKRTADAPVEQSAGASRVGQE